MKIAFLSSFYGAFTGGTEISVDFLKQGLQNNQVEVKVYTTRKIKPSRSDVIYIPLTFIPRKLLILGNVTMDYLIARQAEKLLRANLPDVIHVHDIYITPAAFLIAKKLNLPIVVTVRDEMMPRINLFNKKFVCYHPNYFYCQQADNNYRQCLKCLVSNWRHVPSLGFLIFPYRSLRSRTIINSLIGSNQIIAISNFIKDEIDNIGITKDKIVTIFNAVPDWPLVTSASNRDQINLFAAGRIDEEKGFQTAVRALHLLLNENSKKINQKIHLTIAGAGPYLVSLKKIITELSLNEQISLVGKKTFEQIKDYYFKSDIVIFPTINREPFGRIAVEAMAAGKPLVASNVGGIPEIIKDGETGILVPPNDSKRMAQSLRKLIEAPDLREALGANGRKRARIFFNVDVLAKQTITLYNKVVNNIK